MTIMSDFTISGASCGQSNSLPRISSPSNVLSTNNNNFNNIPTPSIKGKERKPIKMTRAKQWNYQVENAYRFQAAGFRDIEEYICYFETPELWDEEKQFIKMLRVKATGCFMYFRQTRECEDKYLSKIKLYEY